jgi:AcrR family transcriptional regulator
MERSERTREHILQRAAGVFNRQGFSGASMADIMEATGLQKGGIYWHFGSKEQLALEAFDYAVDQANAQLAAALEHRTHALDRLSAVVEAFVEHLANPRLPGGCAVMNTAIESDDGNVALRERARAAMVDLLRAVEGIIAEGQERGEIRAEADARQTATVVVASAEGALAISRLFGDHTPMDQVVTHLRWVIDTQLRP